MDLKNIISLAAFAVFVVYLLMGKDAKRSYLLFVLFAFPIIDLFITPVSMGGFKVFDLITYFALLFIIRPAAAFSKPWTIYSTLILVLFLVLLIGCLLSEFVQYSLITFAQLFSVFIYAWLLFEECHNHPEFCATVIKALKVSCLISLGFLAIQLTVGLSFALYKLNPNASSFDALIRYPSYFQDPQKYGQFLAICSFLFLIEKKKGNKAFLIGAFLFAIVICGIFLSGVRAAFAGLCVGLLIVFAFGEKRYKLMGLACILVGVSAFVLFSEHFALFNRVANVNDSADQRYAYWNGAVAIFSKHPFLGIGLGNYQNYVSIHMQEQYWEYADGIEYVDHPENGYLKLLAEYGIAGFLIMLSFFITPIVRAVKALLQDFQGNKMLLFLIASIVSWMVAFTTMYSFSDLRIFVQVISLLCITLTLSNKALAKRTTYGN